MKKVVILGSSGSIGVNALNIVKSLPEKFKVEAIAVNSNYTKAFEQAIEFSIPTVAIMDSKAADEAASCAPQGVKVLKGIDGLCEISSIVECDLVICAIVGMAALPPIIAAIKAKHDIAIATKEVLVAAGSLVCKMCEEYKVNLLPIDSEHSAIFQALNDNHLLPYCVRNKIGISEERSIEPTIERLILTASGGPFAFKPDIDFNSVTVDQALNHPRWKMGPKVTIDSSTMMNKGLEILEAHWLFNIPVDKIDVLVHPESIVHSLVEFSDGAQIAQLGIPDMRLPIQYSMTWPQRVTNHTLPRLDLSKISTLHFYEPDYKRFPCLSLAREACRRGGVCTTLMNAANEVTVEKFLKGNIRMPKIWETIEKVMDLSSSFGTAQSLDDIFAADSFAREKANEFLS